MTFDNINQDLVNYIIFCENPKISALLGSCSKELNGIILKNPEVKQRNQKYIEKDIIFFIDKNDEYAIYALLIEFFQEEDEKRKETKNLFDRALQILQTKPKSIVTSFLNYTIIQSSKDLLSINEASYEKTISEYHKRTNILIKILEKKDISNQLVFVEIAHYLIDSSLIVATTLYEIDQFDNPENIYKRDIILQNTISLFQQILQIYSKRIVSGMGCSSENNQNNQNNQNNEIEYIQSYIHHSLKFYKKDVDPQIMYKMIQLLEYGGYFNINSILNLIKKFETDLKTISQSYLHGLMLYPLPLDDMSFQIYTFVRNNDQKSLQWILPYCLRNTNYDFYIKLSKNHCIKNNKHNLLQIINHYS